jgi:E3 ubiquitin-protein ligase HECW2
MKILHNAALDSDDVCNGNNVSLMDVSPLTTSAQSFSMSSSLSSTEKSLSASSNASASVHLPPGWEMRVDRHGRLLYVDHVNKRTTWHQPIILQNTRHSAIGETPDKHITARRTVFKKQTTESPPEKGELENEHRSHSHAVRFLLRHDFIRLLHANQTALRSYNESTYLKHIIQRIRKDPSKFQNFQQNKELVDFVNSFADKTQPLPSGWQTATQGNTDRCFFVDHEARRITLIDPRLPHEIKHRARSEPPAKKTHKEATSSFAWEIVDRSEEIRQIVSLRYPELAPRILRKLDLIKRTGDAAIARLTNDIDLITALSILEITDSRPSSEFEEKVAYFYESLQRAGYGQGPGKIRFELRRSHLMDDAFDKILSVDSTHLRKCVMTVTFDEEEGLDYGGPSRELFFLLSRELFNPYYGLFEYSANDTYTVQMSPVSKFVENYLQWYELAGRVLGLCLIHHFQIDTFFTRAFYKFLIGLPYTINDLQSMDTQFHNSLLWIRDNKITDELDLSFSVTEEVGGEIIERELLPGGRNIAVTESNKEQFIALTLRRRIERNVEDQGKALLRGLYMVIDRNYLRVFDEKQLELVISGTVEIDMDDWQENTEYKGGYYDGHVVILWFWNTVCLMSNAERLKLLQFVTGTSALPAEGFKALRGSNGPKKFTIEKWGDEKSLPRAHTCFNRLDLPAYATHTTLVTKLKLAINESSSYAME